MVASVELVSRGTLFEGALDEFSIIPGDTAVQSSDISFEGVTDEVADVSEDTSAVIVVAPFFCPNLRTISSTCGPSGFLSFGLHLCV